MDPKTGLYDYYTVKEEGACFMPRLIKFLKPAYLKPITLVFNVSFPFQVGVGVAAPRILFSKRAQEMFVERHSGYIKEVREAPDT